MEFGNPLKASPKPRFWIIPTRALTFQFQAQGRGPFLEGPGSSATPASAPRWPRTLAGITAYQSCLQYPFTSVPLSGGAPGTRASRRCDRAGRWEPGDYSHCLYTNDITRVLYTFVLVRPEQGWGCPVSSVPGMGWGEASQLPHCSLGMHLKELLIFSGCPSNGFIPSRPHSESAGHPKHLDLLTQQGQSQGENKDTRAIPLPWASGTRSTLPWVVMSSLLTSASFLFFYDFIYF